MAQSPGGMTMSAAKKLITYSSDMPLISGDELYEMVGVEPCELIEGRLVPMSPTGGEHGGIEFSIGGELRSFVRRNKLGYIAGGEVGLYIRRKPDTVRGADVAFFTNQQLPNGLPRGYISATPELIVEIVSPHDSWTDLRAKLRDYFSIGTARVWIVDPDDKTVLIYSALDSYITLTEADTLMGEGALAGFELALAELFE
jgi:Uma2 family endonuclease